MPHPNSPPQSTNPIPLPDSLPIPRHAELQDRMDATWRSDSRRASAAADVNVYRWQQLEATTRAAAKKVTTLPQLYLILGCYVRAAVRPIFFRSHPSLRAECAASRAEEDCRGDSDCSLPRKCDIAPSPLSVLLMRLRNGPCCLLVALSPPPSVQNLSLRKAVEEIVFAFTYPRLDLEVSKHMNHLLKAPFCVHPKTGAVCVPIDPANCADFEPSQAPTLNQVLLSPS
ncbi:unnamed protein product [Closterium sp. Naga37s-1]|nr:unnamed protein product [Closterium sp. Naga37s-1]